MQFGKIKVGVKNDIGYKPICWQLDIQWEGPPIAEVSYSLLCEMGHDDPVVGDYIEFGPYLLYVIERDCVNDSFIVQRVDHMAGALYRWRYQLEQLWRPLTYRLLCTMAIWGVIRPPQPGARWGWYLARGRDR